MPVSIGFFPYFPYNSALITGILNFLSSSAAIFRCSFSGVVVCLSFLALYLSLTSEWAILDAKIIIMDSKLFFLPKNEAERYYREFSWDMAILAVVAWSLACIQQPYAPFYCKYSSFQGIGLYPHCPGP